MRPFSFRSTGLALALAMVCGALALAQQPAQGQRAAGGTGAARASTAAPVFKVEWVQPQGQTGTPVLPKSLYLAQLCERLGPSAVAAIGYE